MNKLAHEKIKVSTGNAVAQDIASKVQSGLSFKQIVEHYTISPKKEAELYEFKARISEALKDGIPLTQVIDKTFTDPKIKKEILYAIEIAKHNNGNEAHHKIKASTGNAVVQDIASKVQGGFSFKQIIEHYTISPKKEAELYEFKARISEALKDGVPLTQVIENTFKDPKIKQEILHAIAIAKAKN